MWHCTGKRDHRAAACSYFKLARFWRRTLSYSWRRLSQASLPLFTRHNFLSPKYYTSFLSFLSFFIIISFSLYFLFCIILLYYSYHFILLYIYSIFYRFISSNCIFFKYLFRIPFLILFSLYRVHGINWWAKPDPSERCEMKRLNREDRRTTRRDVLRVLADPTHTMRKASLLRVSTLLHPPRDSFIVLHRAPSASARMRRSKDFQNVPLAFQHPIPAARRKLSRCMYSLSRHD